MDIRIKIEIVERGGSGEEGGREGGDPLSQQTPEGVSSSGPVVQYCAPAGITARTLLAGGTVGTREAHDVISL